MRLNDPDFPTSTINPTLTDKGLGVIGGLVKLMTFQQIKNLMFVGLTANDVNAEHAGAVTAHNTNVRAHTNLLTAIASLEGAVGSVTSLDTVAQVIVPAINEVRQQVYDLSGNFANIVIDDSALAGITEKTWSVDKIITELQAYKDSILGGAPSAALDTILELSTRLLDDGDAITSINGALSNRVRFDTAQSLTSPQMLQVRQNIGAASQSDVDALALVDNNFVRKDTAVQGLNATEKSNARTNLGLGSASTASDTDGVTEGAANKYFTESRVRGTVLTGISFLSNIAVVATDTVLVALGKLQKQVSDLATTSVTLAANRYSFVVASNTIYNVQAADVTPLGTVIILITSPSPTTISIGSPGSLGKVVGDSVNVRQTSTGVVTLQAASGSLIGNLSFNGIHDTRTLIAIDSVSWYVVGG